LNSPSPDDPDDGRETKIDVGDGEGERRARGAAQCLFTSGSEGGKHALCL